MQSFIPFIEISLQAENGTLRTDKSPVSSQTVFVDFLPNNNFHEQQGTGQNTCQQLKISYRELRDILFTFLQLKI